MQFCVLLLLLFNINSLFLSVILINNHFFSFLRHNVTELKTTQSNLCTMVTLRKWQSDRDAGWPLYKGQLCTKSKRQLKILGSCPVTIIYRVTTNYRAIISVYRVDCTFVT